jgi:DNA adenine methylase
MLKPKPLVPWFGGKARMAKIIADKLPQHKFYVEPFGGAAGVLMAKQPSFVEIYNDLHSGIVTLFRVVRDPAKCKMLLELLDLTPYSREEWRNCNDTWEAETNEIEKARKVYTTLYQNFVGKTTGGSWGFGGKRCDENKALTFHNSLENIRAVTSRFKNVLIENNPALSVMAQWDSPETLIYADPPYLPETRSPAALNAYKYEMAPEQHIELLEFFLTAKSKIILSGYPSELYTKALENAGWVREDFRATASSAIQSANNGLKGKPVKTSQRTESLWFSPNAITTRTLWNLESEGVYGA